MKKTISQTLFLSQVLICLWILISLPHHSPLQAQPVISAQNTALGGGGTAYLGGFEATFYNPANLAIPNRRGTVHIGIGHVGALFEPVISSSSVKNQSYNFADYFLPYTSGEAEITDSQRDNILSTHYSRRSLLSQHRSRADVILGGLLVQQEKSAYSIVLRSRMASRFTAGRGWYDPAPVSSGENNVRDFTLNQQRNQLYEFSFGYAREFTLVNGLFPRLSQLFMGIAPKIVLSGPRFDATYSAQYIQEEDAPSHYRTDFSYQTTGPYSDMTSDYLSSGNAGQAIPNNIDQYDLQPTGYGVGFDFGLTYLIPLDNKTPSLSSDPDPIISKSLRIAFSINDLGLIQERQNPLTLSSPGRTIQRPAQAPMNSMFMGAGGQYLSYLDAAHSLPNPFLEAGEPDNEEYITLLPTSINSGFLLDLTRIKLMGDVALGLNNTAFTTTNLTVNVGLEARPIKRIPLRAGTRLASNLPIHIGLGTGYESRYWDFTIGSQLFFLSQSLTTDVVGGGFAGIQLHL